MRHLIFIILLVLFVKSVYSQTDFDRVQIEKITKFIDKNINQDLDNYILFNINDKYLVIDKQNVNKVHYLSDKKGYESCKVDRSEIIKEVFLSKQTIRKDVKAYSEDDYSDSCPSTFIYFAINDDNNNNIFEFHLPLMLLCDDKKVNYPVEGKILNYLSELILEKWPNG